MSLIKFKDVRNIEEQLNQTIERYKAALKSDREQLFQLNINYVGKFADATGVPDVILKEGDVYEENFSLLFIDGIHSLKVQVILHEEFTLHVQANTNLTLAKRVMEGMASHLDLFNQQLAEDIKGLKLEASEMHEEYREAEERLELIKRRREATLKWFVRPVLITEDDIDAFLDSISDSTMRDILMDFRINVPQRDKVKEQVKEALTL